ncbi:MAG: glycosyltransferase family 2 protein [Acidobacteriaceae bacterium]
MTAGAEGAVGAGDMRLSVIVPARNEEDCIAECLASLAGQSERVFELGVDWELLVVDDGSTDGTRRLAEGFAGVTVMNPQPLEPGWTGKANAVWTAAQRARGQWLLFTDADTVHEPGDLLRALHEAEKAGAALLSYSPRQIVSGFWQRALMPLVFSELASVYPTKDVSDPAKTLAAANGQFLMVEREAYFAVDGHRGVAGSMLEDVALARRIKNGRGTGGKRKIRFRYAPEALSARMYRSFRAMVEGWTKNLALLFPRPLWLAAWRLLDLALLIGLPLAAWGIPYLVLWQRAALVLLWGRTLWRFYRRVAKSNFPAWDCALAVFGLPLFCGLLVSSWLRHRVWKQVGWKGRVYPAGD